MFSSSNGYMLTSLGFSVMNLGNILQVSLKWWVPFLKSGLSTSSQLYWNSTGSTLITGHLRHDLYLRPAKGAWVLNVYSLPPTSALLLGYENTRLVSDNQQIQIKVVVAILIFCGTQMSILLIIEVKSLVLMKWSYRKLVHEMKELPPSLTLWFIKIV